MQVKIVKIEENSGRYGKSKVLYADNGQKYKVNETNKCWEYVKTPGPYEITMGEYQGHPYVQKLRFQGAYSEKAVDNYNASQKAAPRADFAQKLEFDKERQREIKLECYAGIAKDIIIHNAEIDRAKVTAKDVMSMANNLAMLHDDILANKVTKELPEDVDEMVKTVQQTFNGAYEGELPE